MKEIARKQKEEEKRRKQVEREMKMGDDGGKSKRRVCE